MKKKNYLYKLVDTYEWDDSDLTSEIQSNIEPELLEKIVVTSDLISNHHCDSEETFEDPIVNRLYHKYIEEYDGCSKIEIMEAITKGEGYTWEPIDFIEIEW